MKTFKLTLLALAGMSPSALSAAKLSSTLICERNGGYFFQSSHSEKKLSSAIEEKKITFVLSDIGEKTAVLKETSLVFETRLTLLSREPQVLYYVGHNGAAYNLIVIDNQAKRVLWTSGEDHTGLQEFAANVSVAECK